MIRILFFLLVVLLLGVGFAWLADRPGDLVVTLAGMQYKVTLMVAASAIVAIVAAVMLTWWIVKSLVTSPYALRRHFRARKRDRGYQSLSTGLIAAGAGDGETARRMIKQAEKLLNVDQEPLIKLLDAQSAMLEGRAEDARAKFEAMLEDPETKLLGLRGLYLEAQRLGARDASRHYAEEAALLAPNVEWAASAALGQKTTHGDWDGALLLLEKQKATKQVDKEKAKRERAVLLTAKAIETFESDPASAKSTAIEANKLAPDLIPAAIIAAKTLFSQGDLRKGSKVLEYSWKKQPHPEVAETYVHARLGDSVLDRLKRARHLASLYPHHPEFEPRHRPGRAGCRRIKGGERSSGSGAPQRTARERISTACRHRRSANRRSRPRPAVAVACCQGAARSRLDSRWLRFGTLGAGISRDWQARRLRMEGSC